MRNVPFRFPSVAQKRRLLKLSSNSRKALCTLLRLDLRRTRKHEGEQTNNTQDGVISFVKMKKLFEKVVNQEILRHDDLIICCCR